MVASLPALTRLDLNDNTFLAAGAACLRAGLAGGGLSRLTALLLRDGSLGAAGVAQVCLGLATSPPPLAELDLSGHEVRGGGRGGGGGGPPPPPPPRECKFVTCFSSFAQKGKINAVRGGANGRDYDVAITWQVHPD